MVNISNLTTLNETLGILNKAGEVLKNPTIKGTVTGTTRVLSKANQVRRAGGSITQITSQYTILSRVFMDESVIGEIVVPNLMRSMHEWYAAQITAALQISQLVDDKRTISSVLSVVQTGENARHRSTLGNGLSRISGLESFVANLTGTPALEANNASGERKSQIERLNDDREDRFNRDALDRQFDRAWKKSTVDGKQSNRTSVSSHKSSENRIGPLGELFEITMTNPYNKDNSVKIPLYIQMVPSIIPTSVAPRFIDMNVPQSIWQRWTQMKAGELTFWKDFIMGRDAVIRNKSFIKDPEAAAAFKDFLTTVVKKDTYAIADVTDRSTSPQSSNLANSVVVFNEETVIQAKVDSNIDLHKPNDRRRYFANSYTMAIAIIDTLHQRVTIYFNGIDGSLNLGYNDFKPKDSKFDPQDFMTALQAFSTNQIGRMR